MMLIGQDQSGKTSLKKSLKGELFNPDEKPTVGIDRDPSHFKVTTEIWKVGKKTKAIRSESEISYEHHAAQLITKSLTEKEREEEDADSLSRSNAMSNVNSSFDKEGAWKQIQSGDIRLTDVDSASIVTVPSSSRDFDDVVTVGESSPDNEPTIPDEIAALVEQLLLDTNTQETENVYSILWDFGGQSVYYVTHPLFLSPRAMYLLVHDLSQDPRQKAIPLVKQGRFMTYEDQFNLSTNLDYLDFWMTSVASLASQDEDQQAHGSKLLPERLPPIFLICTHADQPFGGVNPRALALEIYGFLLSKPYKTQLCDDVFVVDNTRSGLESECSEVIRLRDKLLAVAMDLPQMKEAIPIKWLKFEKALQVTKEEGYKWITLERAREIAVEADCQIVDDQEFKTLLDFLHDQRVLIHFDDTPLLNNLLVLDLQWLIDVFKKVITVEPYDPNEREFEGLWSKLESTGILEETLLQHVWDPLLDQQETVQSLIAIMEKFSLLCPWPSSDPSRNKEYLVPSMLKSHPPQNVVSLVDSASIPSLFLKFAPDQIPPNFFPRLVLHFFKWCTKEFPSQVTPNLFHNFARFCLSPDTGCSLVLLCHLTSVQVVFLGGNRDFAAAQSVVDLSEQFSCERFEVTSAYVVRNQLALMVDSMRNEFCWLRKMRCEVSFLCPVCSRGGTVDYCRNHHSRGCKQEQCLHFFSESELLMCKQVIICTRSASAQDNRVQIKQFTPWFAPTCKKHKASRAHDSRPQQQHQADSAHDDSRPLPSAQQVAIHQQQQNVLVLPCDVLQTLSSIGDPQDVVVQFLKHLELNQTSLRKPDHQATRWIRCLAKEAKRSDRLDVVKHLRETVPAGTTGPLLSEDFDVQRIPLHERTELAYSLCGGEEWKRVAERLGLSGACIQYINNRYPNPFETVLCCSSLSVGEFYDVLVECGCPVLADIL